jgi:hypothetical protein
MKNYVELKMSHFCLQRLFGVFLTLTRKLARDSRRTRCPILAKIGICLRLVKMLNMKCSENSFSCSRVVLWGPTDRHSKVKVNFSKIFHLKMGRKTIEDIQAAAHYKLLHHSHGRAEKIQNLQQSLHRWGFEPGTCQIPVSAVNV